MDYVRASPRGGVRDSASLSSGLITDHSPEAEKKVYYQLRPGFIHPQTSRLSDRPTNNRVGFYDPHQERDTLQAYNILYGIRQWPFITAEDLIQRAPGRVFIGHNSNINPLDAKNYNPSQALADFEQIVDRYSEAPLGAELNEHPQLTYLRSLEDLKHSSQPSLQTVTALYGMHIDRGAQSYIAELGRNQANEMTLNDHHQQVQEQKVRRLKHRLHRRHIQAKHAHLRMGHKHKKSKHEKLLFNRQENAREILTTSVLDHP